MTTNGHGNFLHKAKDEVIYIGEKLEKLVPYLPRSLIVSFGWLAVSALAVIVLTCTVTVFAVIMGRTVELGWLGRFGVSSVSEAGGIINSPTAMLQFEQRKYLVEMIFRNDPDFDKDMKSIYDCFGGWSNTGTESSVISLEDANKIITNRDQSIFTAIKHHLNHLEGVSVAYIQGVADSAAFETSYKRNIQVWYRRYKAALAPFETHCGCTWIPFEKLGGLWEDKRSTSAPTGKYGDSCKVVFEKS